MKYRRSQGTVNRKSCFVDYHLRVFNDGAILCCIWRDGWSCTKARQLILANSLLFFILNEYVILISCHLRTSYCPLFLTNCKQFNHKKMLFTNTSKSFHKDLWLKVTKNTGRFGRPLKRFSKLVQPFSVRLLEEHIVLYYSQITQKNLAVPRSSIPVI